MSKVRPYITMFLLRVLFKGLLLGFILPAVFYIEDQRNHPEGGTYDFWEGFIQWTLISTAIAFLGWEVEKYYIRKNTPLPAEKKEGGFQK
jgi:hypothetical protein